MPHITTDYLLSVITNSDVWNESTKENLSQLFHFWRNKIELSNKYEIDHYEFNEKFNLLNEEFILDSISPIFQTQIASYDDGEGTYYIAKAKTFVSHVNTQWEWPFEFKHPSRVLAELGLLIKILDYLDKIKPKEREITIRDNAKEKYISRLENIMHKAVKLANAVDIKFRTDGNYSSEINEALADFDDVLLETTIKKDV